MLNFRKIKQDFSSNILKEGKSLHDQKKIVAAKIIRLDPDTVRIHAKVLGNFENTYESELEIDRFESETIHSNCDCPYRYDCQHLAALIYFLEDKMDSLVVQYSNESNVIQDETIDQGQKQEILEAIQEAKTKEEAKKDALVQKQIVQEYISSAESLAVSPFFNLEEKSYVKGAELALMFNPKSLTQQSKKIECQLALRLPFRSKPLQIAHLSQFLKAIRMQEEVTIGGKKYRFAFRSFDSLARSILDTLMMHVRIVQDETKPQKSVFIDWDAFGLLLAELEENAKKESSRGFSNSEDMPQVPFLYYGNLESPLRFYPGHALLHVELDRLEPPANKLLLKPMIQVDGGHLISIDEAVMFACPKPGMIYQEIYFRFPNHINPDHLKYLDNLRDMTIPEPLFGTFVENSLPELKKCVEVSHLDVIETFSTLPFTKDLKGKCKLTYLDGELEAELSFLYGSIEVPAALGQLNYDNVMPFVSQEGILARNLVEERKIIEQLFQDFVVNSMQGSFIAKTEKKIVEFMTEIIPKFQDRIDFDCPQNLTDQFIYDQTSFKLILKESEHVGFYHMQMQVDGALKGVNMDLLWDCISSKRSFIELSHTKIQEGASRFSKILVLDLDKTTKIVQLFDELGITKLTNFKEEKPLWSLVTIDEKFFTQLPIELSITDKLKEIREQIYGNVELQASPIDKKLDQILRSYQKEGVHWLERLRKMYLGGILADDMGLGKTLQAITAIAQCHKDHKEAVTLIVCPTSLLYNWKEEIHRFHGSLNAAVVDGVPQSRKKVLSNLSSFDVVITSYTLLQKDIELYKEHNFAYVILDEAQHIKNRGTRNAKSVKMIKAMHKLILTGTPIENSLEELWSLFDFLMPGFLSSYDRFTEKYIRASGEMQTKNIEYLKKKVSPFILRRMKEDVLSDLPPISEIVYHCQLSSIQQELYRSYAESARDELVKLVEKEGFEKVQIHVLATLTRLKQICCHPAIFAKEKAEAGDSAKYDMLLELLESIVSGGRKTVIFSQYTKMLGIMREDFEQRGIDFCYLDGSTKNRMQVVKEFNENARIPVFLVSLKAGGTGLNLVGADSVIHYDMWWNPAVENQATDRVHRMGQKQSVSSYKLVTLNTIEEKIIEMQKRKKGLVKKVVSCDDEAISKLTWEDVLELLQT
jgi:SNF2 family DNA or RNA helicase